MSDPKNKQMSEQVPLDPAASAVMAKARRLMLVTSAITLIALAVVLGLIGYRVFRAEGSAPVFSEVAAIVPAGAKVISTAIGEGRLAVTVEIAGAAEVWMFDLKTLKPLGRIRLAPQP
jgi:hypothetical protein